MGNITINSSVTKTFPPDTMNFNIHIGKVDENSTELTVYNKSVVDKLIELMEEFDIDEDNLRELYFRISVNREYDQNKLEEKGYKLDSAYTIFSYIDYELMESIREKLTQMNLEFSISYSLEDEEEIRNTLLDEAVKKSLSKAKIIASAGGVQIGDMVAVRYGDNPNSPMLLRATSRDTKEATPKDIDITESVEVEWEFKA